MRLPPIHILLIEDETQIRRFLRMTFEAEGLTVTEAPTGARGLAEAERVRPGLVILDLGLPDMDGVDVVRQLRAWTDVPIVILSARSDEAQKVRALDAGADDYLTKPFGNSELMARMRVHLRKRPAAKLEAEAEARPFLFGDIGVDFQQRRVTRAGEPVHLTPIEFKLLSELAANPGKVLTHAYLLRAVWGDGHSERSHYLRIYMGHLRQKLELDPARPAHIVTETGVGYRLLV
ncbi:response regulator [Pseudoduganella namucuonensis]|uniref:Two component transcriptional regulator, winged helix family n=1 Tax=Pseudoduganella namucuonensis TaxID=1035707 RepID=A0A1I7LPT1_9BURK|nr:response regulator [Pseudoduganella namucuonensis]SFV11686.1 two component transcriptional regulator, winged helix family [Pseudoduganella namucuonensis]